MNGRELSLIQLKRLRQSLAPKLAYVRRLKQRMVATRFDQRDRMLRDAAIAEAALAGLVAEVETLISYRASTSSVQRGDEWPF